MPPSKTTPDVATIVVAAGQSRRFGGATHKLFAMLGGEPLILRTLEMVARWPEHGEVVLVINAAHESYYRERRDRLESLGVRTIVPGGSERQDSVRAGLDALPRDATIVLVHDAARPLAPPRCISPLLEAARATGAAILAVPVADTLKRVASERVVETVDRKGLWQSQTPQAFRVDVLRRVMRPSHEAPVTDEAALCERAGIAVRIVPGDRANLKITTLADLVLAEGLLASVSRESP